MALKDITLGQFFPGSSPIHQLDPRTKILAMVCYVAALFLCSGPLTYGLMLCALIGTVAVSTISFQSMVRGMRPVLFLLVFTALLNVLYTPGRPLVSLWMFTITYEGLFHAFFMVLRILMMISCTFLLTYTTSPLALTDGLEALLSPLNRLRLPVHELAMMMSIALRFLPTLIEETDKIMSAQRARGADFESGSLIQKAKALIPLLVPLIISSFRRADELATAMECRCYHGGEGRTRMHQLHYHSRDAVFLLATLALCALAIVLGRFGW